MISVLSAVVVPPHLSASGASRAAEQLSAALAGRCNISVANMGRGSDEGDANTRITRLRVETRLPSLLSWARVPNRYRTLFYQSDISARVRERDYDLVHLHNPMPALEMQRVSRACLERRIPYVVSTHGFNEVANGHRIYKFNAAQRLIWDRLVALPVRNVVRNAAAVFALSPSDVPLVRELGFRGPDVPIVTNGVDLSVAPQPGFDAGVCKKFGISAVKEEGSITCFFLANHTPNKGLPDLLNAFGRLDRPYLLVVGGERRAQVPYEKLVPRGGPNQRVVITGRLTDDEIAALFRRSDLFVFPTLADTLPLVVLEAMSHGVPVVASRVGGIPFQLGQSAGVLIEPGQPQALAAAIDELAGQPERRNAIAKAAKERVDRYFTWPAAAAAAYAGYERVVSSHPKSHLSKQRTQPFNSLRHKMQRRALS